MKKKVSMIAALMVMLYGGMAFAADWNFYGSARVDTFFTDSDLEDSTTFSESLQSNSRIGAKVTVNDELTGRFEYGTSGGNANIRLLYGEWNFGPGSLTVGKDYTPLYMPVSNQVYDIDNGLGGWGEAYPGRHAQVKLKFGGFQIAAISPDTTYLVNGADESADENTEVTIPRIDLSYNMDMNNLSFGIGGGYSTFEYNNSEDIDSYVGVIKGKFQTGAFSLGGQAFIGQNVGNLIASHTTGDVDGEGYARIDDNQVIDNDAYGVEVVAAYMINEMVSLEAGYGYMKTELDTDNADKEDVASYYLQAPITLASGVFVIPEVGIVDYQDQDQDKITYFGAKWQINF